MAAVLPPDRVRLLVVHCSASPPSVRVDASVIDRWHRDRGFLGIGYHFVIKRSGAVEKGRPLDQVGAHVAAHNHESVGICLVGGVNEKNVPEDNFEECQKAALAELLLDLLKKFPKARIVGHRDLSPDRNGDGRITPNEWFKACPSFDVSAWWAETVTL